MDVSRRSSLCTHVANDGTSPGNRGAGATESGKTIAGRPGQLERSRQEHASSAALQSQAVVDLHERGGNQRQSAADGNSSEHRQYRRFRHETDDRNAAEPGSGETEVADRHQLQSRGGPVRPGLTAWPVNGEWPAVADIMSILSANYKTVGLTVPSKTPYVAVDPASFEGTWSGKYANNKSFNITVSNVSGFRAKVKYQSESTVKYQDVLIRDNSFRVGDTKFMLTDAGKALIKNVVTDPASGSTFLDTAY